MQDVFKIKGFLPYLIVLFINAFVDLGHKIVIQNTIFKTYDGIKPKDLSQYIISKLPKSYDLEARQRYIVQIEKRIRELATHAVPEPLITQDTFCELMRSFTLTEAEERRGCWTD